MVKACEVLEVDTSITELLDGVASYKDSGLTTCKGR